MIELTKPTWNEEFRTMEFRRPDGAGQLNAEETVTAAEVLCTERRTGTNATANMISDVAPYNSTQVRYRLKGGVKGSAYILEIRATTSNGQKLTEYRQLNII